MRPSLAPPSSPLQANQLTSRVLVTGGAELRLRNFWLDDCIMPTMPFSCFTQVTGQGSRVVLEDVTISDATCTDVRQSAGLEAMLYAARYANPTGGVTVRYVDERTAVIEDTGWVPYLPPEAHWRMSNVVCTCTSGTTHGGTTFLPPPQVSL